MSLFSGLINKITTKQASNFMNNINKFDPRLRNAVINKLDDKINNFFSSLPSNNLNPEIEALEDICLSNVKLGMLDNILDFFRYGYYGLKYGKFKLSEYLVEYRDTLGRKLPTQTSTIDLRKGNITESEINDVMKKIF